MKKLFLFALVATMFAACATDETRDVVTATTPETLTVSFEDADSRIQLDNGKTVWTAGDLVSVFYRSNANQKWQFQGETGDRTGTLKRIATMEATHELSNVVVVYPYNENYYINPKSCNIEASLPAEQTYLADSYGVGNNIMVSYGEYNQVVLKSVCGWLKVQLTGNGEKVKYIKLKGNNGEQVAGQIYINSADATAVLASDMGNAEDEGSAGGNLVFEDTVLTEVTLNCGEGVTLGAEPTAFYIALPPQTFEKGLTIDVTATDGITMTQSTDKAVVIERNAIQPMSTFEYKGVPKNEIWYTATEKVEPYHANVFGANIVSNEWNSATGEGVITFDGEVTSIGKYAFGWREKLTGVIIPNSVTEIGDGAFSQCSSLASIIISNSVTTIGNSPFQNCSKLTSVTIPDSVTSIGNSPFNVCSSLNAFYGKFASSDNRCLIVDGVLNSFAPAGLTEYTIPNSVTSIGASAFNSCSSLISVTIPDSVTLIEKAVFNGCSSLISVTIPDSITSVKDNAFSRCSSLTNVIIGSSVTFVGYRAFFECRNLKEVYCKPTTPPMAAEYMFSYYSGGYNKPIGCKIYVPRASVDAYKAENNWDDYAPYIEGYDF